MFTVIFAEKETIKLFEETKIFFGPLYNREHVAFCEWDKYADSFEEMVPGLYDIIEYQSEWRALVLYEDGYKQINPFDYTGYKEPFYEKREKDLVFLKNRRDERFASYEKAISNPLLKLTTALVGIQRCNSLVASEPYEMLLQGTLQTDEYMLRRQLDVLDCTELAAVLGRYRRENLVKFVSEDEIDALITAVKNKDVSGILQLIPDAETLEFIKFIGNDPIYFDPEYTECLIENTKKNELLGAISQNYAMKDKMPTEVLCFSPRTFDLETVEQENKWKKKDEVSSSRFVDFNLYNDKLKFVLIDTLQKDNKQYKIEQIKLLCLLLVVANNRIPAGVISHNNVYRAELGFDSSVITKICENYISKLKSTQFLLKDIAIQLDHESEKEIDSRTAQRLFESDVNIPVKITAESNENELYAEYKELGLSSDCPKDEYSYWANQYRSINKKFVRYLREPRRAVKSAVNEGFRDNNFIKDERTLLLSENQLEDVKLHMDEVEQKMVETTTTHLFNTKLFNEQMQEADKEIRRGISRRMTKSKTITTGLIAILAYIIGFLPLIITNINDVKSFTMSLILIGVVLAIFSIIGFIYLFVLRKRLVNRFKHFNYVMSGICTTINKALSEFSHYISNACNVMRGFSVLMRRDSVVEKTKKVLSYHDLQITKQIENVHDMFSKYVDFNRIYVKECAPYEHDFTVLRDYEYEMPNVYSRKRIEYLQHGNEITVPVDYIDSITLTREEFYD